MIRCEACRADLLPTAFVQDERSPTGLSSTCRRCLEAGQKRDRAGEARKPTFNARRLERYGVTVDEYVSMLDSQGGVCAVCRKPPAVDGPRFSVDHDRSCCDRLKSCGKCLRGVVCRSCANGLGAFKRDPEILARAEMYLKS